MQFDKLAQLYFDNLDEFLFAISLELRSTEAQNKYENYEDYQREFEDNLDDMDGHIDYGLLFDKIHRWKKAKKIEAESVLSEARAANQVSIEKLSLVLKDLKIKSASAEYNSIKLSDAYDKFIKENSVNWKTNGKLKSAYPNEIFPILTYATESCTTGEITSDHINKYKDIVLKLPANRKKVAQYKNKSLDDIYKIEIPENHQISVTTKNNYIERLKFFLEWLARNKYSRPDLDEPLYKVIKKSSIPHDEKRKYSDEDLSSLFNSKQYIEGTHDRPFKFWIPLIGLLSGARINEIAQLTVNDIYEDTKAECWVFDINTDDEDGNKSLKRNSHKRRTPVHPILIELGLNEYAATLKKYGETRLFPELQFNEMGNYGVTASKWFNNTYTNTRNCNISTPKTSFHSLRHNFIDYVYSKLNTSETAFAHYLGQSAKGGVGATRYAKPAELKTAFEVIEKVDYSYCIEFKKIKNWKRQRFGIQLINSRSFIKSWVKEAK